MSESPKLSDQIDQLRRDISFLQGRFEGMSILLELHHMHYNHLIKVLENQSEYWTETVQTYKSMLVKDFDKFTEIADQMFNDDEIAKDGLTQSINAFYNTINEAPVDDQEK